MKQHLSVRASWLLAIIHAFEHRGHAIEPLLDEAHIDKNDLHDENAHIDISQAHKLFSLIERRIPEPEFGLDIGLHAHPTTFGSLGFLLLSSTSLKEALSYLEQYFSVFCNIAYIKIEETSDELVVSVIPWTMSVKPLAVINNAFFAVLVKFLQQLTNNQLALNKVTLASKGSSRQYEQYFHCPVQLSSNVNSLAFDKLIANKNLATGNLKLSKLLERQIIDELSLLKRADLSAQVYCKICELLPKGLATQQQVAKELNISIRKLQLQLQRENNTYQNISSQVRKSLAQQYIKDRRLTINEISHNLGFANSSNFHRTFKRWFGIKPNEFRQHDALHHVEKNELSNTY